MAPQVGRTELADVEAEVGFLVGALAGRPLTRGWKSLSMSAYCDRRWASCQWG